MNQNLLLLHGALGVKEQFNSLKSKLWPGFEVHTLDFEGHGEDRSSNAFSMERFTHNVLNYLNEHKLGNTNIFGYSMGGYVALNFARKHPAKVEKIMTLGTKFDWTKESAAEEIKLLNPEKIEEKVPGFASQLASIHTKNNWKEVVDKTAQMMKRLGEGQKLRAKDFKTINHDVLIGIGSEDTMVSVPESRETADLLPRGKMKIIAGVPHPIEKVDVDTLAPILMDFIKK